jgi:hypothetical protein
MNYRVGWQFFIQVVNERPFYIDEMVRWLKDQFPSMRDASDAELLRFLQSRASAVNSGG